MRPPFHYRTCAKQMAKWSGSDKRCNELGVRSALPRLFAAGSASHGPRQARGSLLAAARPPSRNPPPTATRTAVGVVTVYLTTLITRWGKVERTRYVIKSRQQCVGTVRRLQYRYSGAHLWRNCRRQSPKLRASGETAVAEECKEQALCPETPDLAFTRTRAGVREVFALSIWMLIFRA
jgi:hypothetical protein